MKQNLVAVEHADCLHKAWRARRHIAEDSNPRSHPREILKSHELLLLRTPSPSDLTLALLPSLHKARFQVIFYTRKNKLKQLDKRENIGHQSTAESRQQFQFCRLFYWVSIVEWYDWIGQDLEGRGHILVDIISWSFPGWTEETNGISVRIGDISDPGRFVAVEWEYKDGPVGMWILNDGTGWGCRPSLIPRPL